MKIACIQFTSSADISDNIERLEKCVAEAAASGAEVVFTPENIFLMESANQKRELYSESEHPAIHSALQMAAKNGVWLLIGSVAVVEDDGAESEDKRCYNRSILISPSGDIVARYDKIHLFDVEVGDGQIYRESAKIKAGNRAVLAKTPFANIGLAICYDLRFPHLFRNLAKAGAHIISVPAAFTQKTGEAHWHVLLRARAIENGCFIVAPAQTGTHAGGRRTYGHSLVIDPWGRVLADGGDSEGIIYAEIDISEVAKIRANLPSLSHDREFALP